ncbi:hypothetical protein B0H19DRAFT_1233181 [Mycena capillaripes]|nr:hypothetical protein B0H19DRAFT_1233181 [Mycena capillaripes]
MRAGIRISRPTTQDASTSYPVREWMRENPAREPHDMGVRWLLRGSANGRGNAWNRQGTYRGILKSMRLMCRRQNLGSVGIVAALTPWGRRNIDEGRSRSIVPFSKPRYPRSKMQEDEKRYEKRSKFQSLIKQSRRVFRTLTKGDPTSESGSIMVFQIRQYRGVLECSPTWIKMQLIDKNSKGQDARKAS